MRVPQKQVLHGDSCSLPSGHADFQSLFGLDGLMNPITPLATFGKTAGKFVHDDNLIDSLVARADDVLPVEQKLFMHFDTAFGVLV